MQKKTHLIFALLFFLILNKIFHFPLYTSVFAIIGTIIPDIDLRPRKYHRKICHNLFFLGLLLIIGYNFFGFSNTVAIVFSMGFVSHLISDSFTPMGIMPLWPLKKPKFNGKVSTGSIEEYLISIGMLFVILVLLGIVNIAI